MNVLRETLKYVKYWYIFLLSGVLCLTLAFLYVRFSTPVYKISSTLLIKENVGPENKVKESAFSDLNMFQSFSTVQNEIEVFRSRDLLYKVLDELSLETAYFVKRNFKTTELYGEKRPISILAYKFAGTAFSKEKLSIKVLNESRFVLTDSTDSKIYKFNQLIKNRDYTIKVEKGPAFAVSGVPILIRFKNLAKMAESYSLSQLTVVPVIKDANTIILSLHDAVPQRGIDILNKLIEIYNQENIRNKEILAQNTIDFIDKRLRFLSEDLSGVEQDVESYKQQHMVTNLNSDAQLSVQNSGAYNQQLSSADIQLNIIRSIESYLQKAESKTRLVPSALTLQDQTLAALTSKYNDLQLERQRLLRNVRPDNPLIKGIDEQLAGLKSSMQEGLGNVKRGLLLERNSLRNKTSKYASEIKKMPEIERGLLERSRAQNVKGNLVQYLLQKREETALSLSSTVPSSQIVDRPAYNSAPESPKADLIYLCSIIIGLSIPFTFIYLKGILYGKVQSVTDLHAIEGIRILGELSNKGKEGSVVIQKDSRSTISELFRYIRTELNFSKNTHNKVFLITSSMKGEGKTFFSINLALSMALIDKKVALLEFDLRKPDLLSNIGIESDSIGLSDYLSSDSIDIESIIRPSNLSPYLSVIGCGTMPENPSELLMSYRLATLFEELRKKFDYIIVDTSPVGQVADAFSIGAYSDASIYLVRYNFTNLYQLEVLRDIYECDKLVNLQVVINDAKKINGNVYGYGRYNYSTNRKSRQLIAG